MEETKELTLPEQARDQAKNYFRQGMNCTECVMQSFLDIHGSDLPPEVIALATVFGGGMGHTKNTCGAITGGVMSDPHGDFEGKSRKKNCMQMIGDCAEIAMKYIMEAEGKTV